MEAEAGEAMLVMRDGRRPRRRRGEPKAKRPRGDNLDPTDFIIKLSRAMLGRLLFVAHSLLTIWQCVDVYKESAYWGFSLISIAIFFEGAITIMQRGGDERKWLCPSVLLFIMATAPPIWFLEMDLSARRLVAYTKNGTQSISVSGNRIHAPMLRGAEEISHEMWVQLLEQFLLVILIIGRWMLPKGEITREQLSQILLAFLAIASDIVELFDLFKEVEVTKHNHLRHLLLAAWSTSLVQFGFVLTTSKYSLCYAGKKARKMRVAITSASMEDLRRIQYRLQHGNESIIYQILRDSDIWAILLANFLQDVPFFIVRLYLMIGYNVFGYTMIFFTCKNALIIALQGGRKGAGIETYRLVILVADRYQDVHEEDDAKKLAKHYRQLLTQCKDNLASLRRTHPHLLPPLKAKANSTPRHHHSHDPRHHNHAAHTSETREDRPRSSPRKPRHESKSPRPSESESRRESGDSRQTLDDQGPRAKRRGPKRTSPSPHKHTPPPDQSPLHIVSPTSRPLVSIPLSALSLVGDWSRAEPEESEQSEEEGTSQPNKSPKKQRKKPRVHNTKKKTKSGNGRGKREDSIESKELLHPNSAERED